MVVEARWHSRHQPTTHKHPHNWSSKSTHCSSHWYSCCWSMAEELQTCCQISCI